ncbi:MAG: 50S ribosomal protein L11 methyltransferase [Anaerolineae bacterium]|jgi:ribosomal protein L11 methyltransferase|nr:50S ribosomal protein L11 methyltransferase [Anaerolineae bacterium]MBT7190410.1 50S ribosomal protein L11 methyltransferase [Anaerolineae bacterium]MBT7988913.1 50S ribosomal protein L11 methyltransferase [Anaerolineae bacterium]
MNNWLEVSLTVDGEMAEAVADVFARYAPGGVVAERGIKYLDADDPGTPKDEVIVRAYLPVDARLEETRQRLEQGLSYLNMIHALPAPTFTPIKDANWMEAWKEHYRPISVGKKLIIIPAWMESPDESRIPIKIDPGMAFGTGTHPTTQLVLDLMEDMIIERAPSTLIDVGCGSGILSIAALKLGVERALGVDIESASVESSRENADVNEIGEEFIIGQGSVDEILAGNFEFKSAPIVVANMLAPILIRLTEAGLGTLVSPGGILILSGILDEQEERIRAVAASHQLKILERRQMGDWIAFALRPALQ